MAVGFIAMFKGEHIQRGIALTGTIEPEDRSARWQSPDKIRAAAREGIAPCWFHGGRFMDAAVDLNDWTSAQCDGKEVDTIDEAYQLMTGNESRAG